jgi:hypothetical protein
VAVLGTLFFTAAGPGLRSAATGMAVVGAVYAALVMGVLGLLWAGTRHGTD